MKTYEIRDPGAARRHVLQGLLLSRAAPLSAERVASVLAWGMEIVSDGSPLPPIGFVADIGQVAFGAMTGAELTHLPDVHGLDHTVTRRYEDYVLGKLYADISLQRGSDALLRYGGRDRNRGLAYLVNQLRLRCRLGGAILSPAVIKGLMQTSADTVIELAWRSADEDGIPPALISEYETLISAVRNTGELLGPEDLFELESGTALAEFGQRIALRQVLQMAALLQRDLPKQKPRAQPRSYSVATNIMEEDHYPIGGFASISNRGTIESLVRSELAYIDDDQRPDLFDIKFARNELLYYSRDENQFLRRRLSFVFVLYPDLATARIKDRELPCQRIILLLACLYVCVRQLLEWLRSDAIRFEFLFVEPMDNRGLTDERALVETLLREEMLIGNTVVDAIPEADVSARCAALGRVSLCQTLAVTAADTPHRTASTETAWMLIDGYRPALILPNPARHDPQRHSTDEFGVEGWQEQLDRLLRCWV